MWAFLKRIFRAKDEIGYSQLLAKLREFEVVADEVYDLKERFNRFQNRSLMRAARDQKNGVDQDLIDQAREIAAKNDAPATGPKLVPGTFRRRTP